MATQEPLTLFSPLSPRNSGTCGYCGPPGQRSAAPTNYHAAEGVSEVMNCRVLRCYGAGNGSRRLTDYRLLVGVPGNDGPGLEAIGDLLLQTGLEAVMLPPIYDQVISGTMHNWPVTDHLGSLGWMLWSLNLRRASGRSSISRFIVG